VAGSTMLGILFLAAAIQWAQPLDAIERLILGGLSALNFYRARSSYKQVQDP
jgi:hypothetical protein